MDYTRGTLLQVSNVFRFTKNISFCGKLRLENIDDRMTG